VKKACDPCSIAPERIAGVVALAIDRPEDTVVNAFTAGPAKRLRDPGSR